MKTPITNFRPETVEYLCSYIKGQFSTSPSDKDILKFVSWFLSEMNTKHRMSTDISGETIVAEWEIDESINDWFLD